MTVSAYQAILIAGFGSRLHPLCNTKTAPKALLPVANQATLRKCVAWIEAGGIKGISPPPHLQAYSSTENALTINQILSS